MNSKDPDMQAEYDFSNAKRGPVVPPRANVTQITLRLDSEVLEWFRNQMEEAGGGNYQELINIALREYVLRNQGEALESTLRRIIREELRTAA